LLRDGLPDLLGRVKYPGTAGNDPSSRPIDFETVDPKSGGGNVLTGIYRFQNDGRTFYGKLTICRNETAGSMEGPKSSSSKSPGVVLETYTFGKVGRLSEKPK